VPWVSSALAAELIDANPTAQNVIPVLARGMPAQAFRHLKLKGSCANSQP